MRFRHALILILFAAFAFAADRVVTLNPGESLPTRVIVNSGDTQTVYNPAPAAPLPTSQPTATAGAEADFSEPPLAPGAQRFYVAANGNDNNPGTIVAPFATLQKGAYMLRPGKGDRVYARCGDTFYGTVPFNASGIVGFPTGFFTYGNGPRPHLLTKGSGFLVPKVGVQHFAIVGYWVTAQNRNPADPAFNPQAPNTVGIDVRHNLCADWLVDDCKIEFFDDGIATQADGVDSAPRDTWQTNVTIRRNIIVDSWGNGQFDGQGCFLANVDGLTIDGNFFDHNGWNERIPSVATRKLYSHSLYVYFYNSNVVVRNNYCSQSSGFGIQQRPGGECSGNVIYMCGNAGLGSGASFYLHDNVVMGGMVENMKQPFGSPGVGHGGFELAAGNNLAERNYFWGIKADTIPGGPITYAPAPFQISRRPAWTPPGTISFTLRNNAIWSWPNPSGGAAAPNELTVFAPPQQALDRNTNPPVAAPVAAEVWPSGADIQAMRSRSRGQWLPQYYAPTIVAKFNKAAGR